MWPIQPGWPTVLLLYTLWWPAERTLVRLPQDNRKAIWINHQYVVGPAPSVMTGNASIRVSVIMGYLTEPSTIIWIQGRLLSKSAIVGNLVSQSPNSKCLSWEYSTSTSMVINFPIRRGRKASLSYLHLWGTTYGKIRGPNILYLNHFHRSGHKKKFKIVQPGDL